MKARLVRFWDSLRASYWFISALLTLAAIGAAQGVLLLDRALHDAEVELMWWLGAGEPDGARGLLSTIAGSMITVAGAAPDPGGSLLEPGPGFHRSRSGRSTAGTPPPVS